MDPRASLQEALQALYHHTDPDVRSAANKWLEEYQRTIESWGLSDTLLHDPTSSYDVQYFCALTLRTKVQRDYEELPPGAPLSLRSSLMNLLVRFNSGPATVRTQLCLAMAALAIHMPSEEWGSMGVIRWLGQELRVHPDAAYSLMELLASLPTEAYGTKVSARPERKRQFQKELAVSAQDALNLLSSCYVSEEMRGLVLDAFAAWLRLSNGIPANVLALHPLVQASLTSLQNYQTFDSAVDAVTELIRYTVHGCPDDVAVHMPLVQIVVPCVMSLRPRFDAALKVALADKQAKENGAAAKDTDLNEDEEETIKGIAYLFAEMGESYVGLIASGSDEAMMIVEALVAVTSHPDFCISSMTFNFWHRLSLLLTKREHYSSFGSGAAGEAERERRLKIFRPQYKLLVSLVSFHVTYPPDYKSWRKDEDADFREARADIAHMLVDATVVLGGEETLALLAEPLLQISIPTDEAGWNWRPVEASLYCIRAIAKAVALTEMVILPRFLTMLPRLPTQAELLYTSCLTVGAYADWLGSSDKSAELLPMILKMLRQALFADQCSAAAALALKHVCDACRTQLAGSLDDLLGFLQQAMTGSKNFHSDDELQLIDGISYVLSALPPERLSQALQAVCCPLLLRLQQLLSNPQTGISDSQYTSIIDKIAHIFRYVSQPEALAELFKGLWPTFDAIFELKAGDVRIMERLCRACKYAVRTCKRAMSSSMSLLLSKLQGMFQLHHHPCFLYLASEAIKTFGADPACGNYLSSLISALCTKAFDILKSLEDFTANPDLADDCFLMASRCIRYCPHILVMNGVFPQMLTCASLGILNQHREACRSALTFLRDVIELCISFGGKSFQAFIDGALLPIGSFLTRVLIAALVGALPTSRLDEVINLIVSLARLYGQKVVAWAQEAASLVPTSFVTDSEKASFLHAVLQAANGSETATVTAPMEDISTVCRRNKKVLDAVQLALRPSQVTLVPAV